jgi:hypothetical protein
MKKSLITCNHKIVERLVYDNSLPEYYLNDNYKTIFNRYQSDFKCAKFMFDRSGNTPHYLNVDSNIFKIPTNTEFNLSFEEVSILRAKELLSLGKPINVSWSGGLDSTYVLCLLHYLAIDKSQVKVYGTYNSVLESGTLFDKFIRPNFEYDIHVNTSYKSNYPLTDEVYVTGSMGNNIFYQDLNFWQPDSWMKFKSPCENPIYKYAEHPYEHVLQEDNLEFLHNSIVNSPRKLESLQDLRWWIQFAFNWHTTRSNSYVGLPQERCSNIHAFFASDEFQLWSITNNEPKTKVGDYSDERWQMREFIKDYIGDSYYSKNKKNQTSVLSSFENDWVFLLNDYSNIYLQDL